MTAVRSLSGFRPFRVFAIILFAAVAIVLLIVHAMAASPEWTSRNRCRVLLTVDSRGVKRSNSPASVDLNFVEILKGLKAEGTLAENTVEVVAYDSSGKPRVFDRSRAGSERHLLPHRVDHYYGIDGVTFSFVMPDEKCASYAVYFDTNSRPLGRDLKSVPSGQHYAGLVGDGDWFRQVYSKREIGASHMDDFADIDGDGDLDLFKVTVEPYIYCYENVGTPPAPPSQGGVRGGAAGNRLVPRGKLTSAGKVFKLPYGEGFRCWAVLEFADWDGDGDQDLFATCSDGPEAGEVIVYENTTPPGGLFTLTFLGRLTTVTGKTLGAGWFPAPTVVDWDGDGKNDLVVARGDKVDFFRNVGSEKAVSKIKLADAVTLDVRTDGPKLMAPRVDCADIDSDGDLDLLLTSQGPPVWLIENTGTRTNPVLAPARKVADIIGGHNGAKLADFDGDGLIDFVASGLWECPLADGSRHFARLYKNVGARAAPQFEERDASGGCPYTEAFQTCDAGRQNTMRAVDWNSDGNTDLIGNSGSGAVCLFHNTADNLWPVFSREHVLFYDTGGIPRESLCDWNDDGKTDVVVTFGTGAVTVRLNKGTDSAPVLADPVPLQANGVPIKLGAWPSVLVCDWDLDGNKDLIAGMGGGPADPARWPAPPGGQPVYSGFLFYRNTGTDAEPVLAYPKWITARDGTVINFVRPNLGSYVDWDGDGKRDFIICQFENAIRLYRNIGSGKPGDEPVFENAEGVLLVAPPSPQLVSGVDALDWNGDGDIDILTGQGHGGSGLRFFEHDYVMDCLNKTFPRVEVGACERRK